MTASPWVLVAEAPALAGAFATALAVLDADGAGVPEAAPEADGEAVVTALAGTPERALATTGRKYSLAVVPMVSSTCWEFCPFGIVTTMVLLPSVCTSASDTPVPLTRSCRIATASFMLVELIAPESPLGAFAWSVTLVPPARSMPRCGVLYPVANMMATRATAIARIRLRARPGYPSRGRDLGEATFSILSVHAVGWGAPPPPRVRWTGCGAATTQRSCGAVRRHSHL